MASSNPEQSPESESTPYTCADILAEGIENDQGILEAKVNHRSGEIEFRYDPAKVSTAEIRAKAKQLAPAMHASISRTTLHLSKDRPAVARRTAESVANQPGVHRATASYLGQSVTITFAPDQTDASQLYEAAKTAGHPIESEDEAATRKASEEAARRGSLWQRFRYYTSGDRLERLFVLTAFLGMSFGFVVEHTLNAPLLVNLLYLISYLTGGYFGTVSAWESLKERSIDIDLLMILAALGAALVGAPFEGAMLLFLFALSNVLQSYAMGRTRNAIESLAKLRPRTARVLQGNETFDTPLNQVAVGDHILIRPSEQVPLDGEVFKGESSIDQSSVTGESIPVRKKVGDLVYAGTLNQNGSLTLNVTKTAGDSTLARMIALVEEAQSRKANSQRFLENAEQNYAIGVILLTAFLALILPTAFGMTWGDAFYRAITVMVVASPCALVISTPASILSAIANAARHGILFKGGAQLEKAARIRTVAFDKTGTLTQGQPSVTAVEALQPNLSLEDILQLAASLESHSEHPLGNAIVKTAKERNLQLSEAHEIEVVPGRGIRGSVEQKKVLAGSPRWLLELKISSPALEKTLEQLSKEQDTTIILATKGADEDQWAPLGLITIADPVRPESKKLIQSLHEDGITRLAMLTGDSKHVAENIARQIGLDEVYAELLPEAKVSLINSLAQDEDVAMVGDGTNDAPALATATLGIAMGAAGNDIAMESADVVLMSNDLNKIRHVLGISRAARDIVYQNLIFAGGIIILMVIATLALPIWNIHVPLPIGVLAHEGGTVLVCLNGLRLLAYKINGEPS